MDLENKIEAQRKRMEQEKNKLDMLMKKQRQSREQHLDGDISNAYLAVAGDC